MSKEERERYEPTEKLHQALAALKGRKFVLDCGHHVTMGHHLGNNITVCQMPCQVICSQCGY